MTLTVMKTKLKGATTGHSLLKRKSGATDVGLTGLGLGGQQVQRYARSGHLHLMLLLLWLDLQRRAEVPIHEFNTWPSREIAKQPLRASCTLAGTQPSVSRDRKELDGEF